MDIKHAKQMLAHLETTQQPGLQIGPRTRHEIELRIRELRARHHPTMEDRREVVRLEEFLRSIALAAVVALSLAVTCVGPVRSQEAEPEHSFDSVYDPMQENALLALDCDARVDPAITGEARDKAVKSCVGRMREAINAAINAAPNMEPVQ